MGDYIKLFETHNQYESYTADTSSFIKPNVSFCKDQAEVIHYNPLRCEETSVYEVIGEPSYPSTIDGDATSFDITVNYKRIDIGRYCQETITEGTDTVTVECGQNPSTSSTRTVSGSVDFYGNEIEYSVTQSKFVAKIIAKFNVTSTSEPTRIASATTSFTKIEIDGITTITPRTGYTFSTTGEHTVKYTSINQADIGYGAFCACSGMTSVDIPSGVTSIGRYAFWYCSGLTSITVNAVTPPTLDNMESLSNTNNCPIYVPTCSLVSTYQSARGWSIYKSRICALDCPTLTAVFNVTSTSSPTRIASGTTGFSSIEIDGVKQPSVVSAYTFSTTGEHTVKYYLKSTSIGDSSFNGCSGLTSIDIPDSVTSVGNYAFYSATSLTSIVCNATTAPTIQSTTFQVVKTGGTLAVPIGSTGYDVWMGTGNYYLGMYNWTKVEQ